MKTENASVPSPAYRLGRDWVLRMTGFPMELLLALRSSPLAEACDRVVAAEQTLADVARRLLALAPEAGTATADYIRKRLSVGKPLEIRPAGIPSSVLRAVEDHTAARLDLERANTDLRTIYSPSFEVARRRLYATVREELFRHALLLSSPELEELTKPPDPDGTLPERNAEWRRREATWVSYLQRFTMKNETISFFGPCVWGVADSSSALGVDIELDDRFVDRRVVYFERGTCDAIVSCIAAESSDVPKDPLPVTAKPFDELRTRVEALGDAEIRSKWLARLGELDALREAFESHPDAASRRRILADFDALFERWAVQRSVGKGLYASRLPVNEDCRRAAHRVLVGRAFMEPAETDLVPWYELWRDVAGLYASRLFDRLSPIHASLGASPRLDEFLAAVTKAGLPFDRNGGLGLVPGLDKDIQSAWQEQLGGRSELPEVALTPEDLTFVRRCFQFERMTDGDIPSPDFHLAAPNAASARDGHGTVILGEIHPDYSLWQHGLSLYCPDLSRMVEDYRASHRPALLWGRHLELSAHTSMPRAAMGTWSAVVPFGPTGVPSWRPERLIVERNGSDFLVRTEEGAVLGSLLHSWAVAMNTHRLEFLGTATHSPRLRVGRVIVQRESWLVDPGDEIRKMVEQSGPDLLVGIRRFRHQFKLPQEVFVRPILPLRITTHKDGKPIYIDFDNPFLAEMLGGLARKFLQFRVTEVLPRVEDSWLADSRGRYSFELRMTAYPSDGTTRTTTRGTGTVRTG